VTIAEACARFGASKAAVARARKHVTALSLAELAVAALTDRGTKLKGPAADFAGVARWLDYVNHDGSTVDDVKALLVPDWIAVGPRGWRLLAPWP
jgi:hypothetical protein